MASEMSDNPMDVSETIYQPQSNGDGKSWEELRTIVKGTRKTVTALACRVPSSFCFRSQMSQSGPTTRLYFLGIPPKQRESTLMYVNVPETPMNITPMLQWCPLFEGLENAGSAQMSKEEQLLRERKRLGVFGITSYEVTDDRGILFPACNTLFQCKDDLTKDEPLVPDKIDSDIEGSRMDPKICPTNSNLVAFVRNKDLWVVNTATQLETRLTTSNKGSEHLKEDPYSSGVPSFVVQEEFDRYTGYWWSPAEPCKDENGQQTYTILYEYVDESGVDIIPIYGPFEDKGVDEYRYPRPGKTNATSALQIIDFCITEDGNEIVSKRSLCDDYLMASYEYLVRAGWTPDGKYIHCQWLNRRQTNLALFVIPVNHFHPACSGGNEDRSVGPEKCHNSHRGYRMLEDESQIWVNVHDIIHFLPSTSDGTFEYIWLSERSGFRHLYRVTSQLPLGEEISVAACSDYIPPEMFNFKSKSGFTMYGMYYKPQGYQPGVKYPTGNSLELTSLKIKSETEGTTEIEDQVEGLQWLMSNVDFIDEKRVAIHGWSYGGCAFVC
ncbi:DPP9-like protein [Mya arenaria]|uniref:DPP9-like protein n=1 Tax=Mya arenaria TaxID=6604 RepID=A0ABY7G6J8_MYAAR|nr:DPP9-like protein [Mya arenaria]